MVNLNSLFQLMDKIKLATPEIIPHVTLFIYSIGFAVFITGVVSLAWTQLEPKIRELIRKARKARAKKSSLDPRIAKILGIKHEAEQHSAFFKHWQNLQKYLPMDIFKPLFMSVKTLVLVVLLALGGFILGAFWFKNLPAALMGAFLGILIPGNFLSKGDIKKQDIYLKQLPVVIRTMAVNLESTGSIHLALIEATKKAPEPIKDVFNRVVSALSSGKRIEAATVIISEKIQFGHAKLLTLLINEADREGATLIPQFARLANQIDGMHELAMENAVNLAPGRLSDVIIHLLIILIAFGITYVVPEAYYYLTQEAFGKIIVLANFISPVISIFTDRIFSRVEV